ncbi:hypothetical protein Ocin01_00680 [Orchesella cincta]|uniref:Uncharacterized protein n=1 Tax=Orchesella cincta TaxID=48709 RepID=A0A1D2NL56_ORCCI|nr:hypothetical protein Ocin01_00680 [Orchesella cincta]
MKELDGLRKGFRVSAIVNNQLEQGTVKWIGTIKGTMYIGIEFERAVGNQFPETSGAAPFPCSVSHSRLVFPEDVKRTGVQIMEQKKKLQQQDENHYLLRPASFLCLSDEVAAAGGGVVKGNGNMNHRHHKSQTDISISSSISDDDSQFVLTAAGLSPVNRNGDEETMELTEFHEKLTFFYKCCTQAKRLIKELRVKYEELPIHCRFEDCAVLNVNLEKVKGFKSEVEENILGQLDRCKLEMETVMRFPEILLPSEERKMSQEIQEVEQSFSNFDQEMCNEIEGLENFSVAYQNLQDFLQERYARFTVIKTRLVQVEKNLVKDESALSLRIKGIQSILSVLERDHDSSENSELSRLLSIVRLYDYMDISRMLSQTQDLILAENYLLQDVRTKRALLTEARVSYNNFMARYSKFHSWYFDYMKRLGETKATGQDFDVQYPSLVTEREEKRAEFIEILSSARSLRASIFDHSAVDQKIEVLQDQWKVLVEKVYRARSRKTV